MNLIVNQNSCALGRNKTEEGEYEECKVKYSSIKIASGVHELRYIDMHGRIIIDLYNYFRSVKLIYLRIN